MCGGGGGGGREGTRVLAHGGGDLVLELHSEGALNVRHVVPGARGYVRGACGGVRRAAAGCGGRVGLPARGWSSGCVAWSLREAMRGPCAGARRYASSRRDAWAHRASMRERAACGGWWRRYGKRRDVVCEQCGRGEGGSMLKVVAHHKS